MWRSACSLRSAIFVRTPALLVADCFVTAFLASGACEFATGAYSTIIDDAAGLVTILRILHRSKAY
jgi:hypothetical protein